MYLLSQVSYDWYKFETPLVVSHDPSKLEEYAKGLDSKRPVLHCYTMTDEEYDRTVDMSSFEIIKIKVL